jgi:hypothetical protein
MNISSLAVSPSALPPAAGGAAVAAKGWQPGETLLAPLAGSVAEMAAWTDWLCRRSGGA